MRGLWFTGGVVSVLLGALGIFLPLLPTVPFLLLAAFCFARSSPKAHDWLLNHKTLGPPIHDWQTRGAIRRGAKIAATFCIVLAFLLALFLGAPTWALVLQVFVLSAVLSFIWTRPAS